MVILDESSVVLTSKAGVQPLVGALPDLLEEFIKHLLREATLVIREELSDALRSVRVSVQVEVAVTTNTDRDGTLRTCSVRLVVLKLEHHPARNEVVASDAAITCPVEGVADTTHRLAPCSILRCTPALKNLGRDGTLTQSFAQTIKNLALTKTLI